MKRQPTPRAIPRLYLVAPAAHDLDALERTLAVADIAAVLLRLPAADERSLIKYVKAIAPAVQEKGIALVLDGHPDIVARAGADGCQLAGITALQAALPALKPARIAGAGGLATRHDAMAAAEAGADYVLFGEPDENGRRPLFEAVVERVAWWAELFEAPCVGFAGAPDEVAPLVSAGADFVAVDFVFADARGPEAAIRAAAAELAPAERVS